LKIKTPRSWPPRVKFRHSAKPGCFARPCLGFGAPSSPRKTRPSPLDPGRPAHPPLGPPAVEPLNSVNGAGRASRACGRPLPKHKKNFRPQNSLRKKIKIFHGQLNPKARIDLGGWTESRAPRGAVLASFPRGLVACSGRLPKPRVGRPNFLCG